MVPGGLQCQHAVDPLDHQPAQAALADRTVSLLDGRRVNTVHLPPVAETEGRAACSLSV